MNDIIGEILKAEWCESFALRLLGPDRWVVDTPFQYGDGDGLPAFLTHDERTGWSMTDDGMAISHLFFDDAEFTEVRFSRLSTALAGAGVQVTSDKKLVMTISGDPTVHRIADFLQAVAQVQGIARTWAVERDAERYRASVRSGVEGHLVSPDWARNWTPPRLQGLKAKYEADLRISAGANPPVVLFAASTSDRANVAALTVRHFYEANERFAPVLAVHPDRVSGEAIFRFQDEVDDDDAVVRVEPGFIKPLILKLGRSGVEVRD